jgi:glycosyltransferase involved in cell wall biosynthesis
MLKISLYTFVKDGLYYDFHVVDMLKHHLPLADEIIVNEGYSDDGTYEAIRDLDPKIKVYRNVWDRSDPSKWHVRFKDQARQLCTGDWCILLDCDEFIPEWEFGRLRDALSHTDKVGFPMRYVHFYGNYKVVNLSPEKFHWPVTKLTIHRNLDNMEIWGDGSNVRVRGPFDRTLYGEPVCDCHHFGFVRNPARLRQKWRTQAKQHNEARPKWDHTPGFLFDLMPHSWDDKDFVDDLALYDGPYVQAVRDNPDEFVRDNYDLLKVLANQKQRDPSGV